MRFPLQFILTTALSSLISFSVSAQTSVQTDQYGKVVIPKSVTAGQTAASTDYGNAPSAAKSSQGSDIVGELSSLAVGGYMMSQCAPPTNVMPCILGAMAFAQAGSLVGSASGAGDTAAGLSSGLGGSAPTVIKAPTGSTGTDGGTGVSSATSAGSIAQQYQILAQTLASKGVGISADGQSVNLPDGSSVPMSSMSSSGAMSAAGMSAADIAKAQDLIAAGQAVAKEKIKSLGQLTADGGGGAGAAGAGLGDSGSSGASGRVAFPWEKKKNAADKGTSVSGMSKKLGEDNIGVSGDDIFQMINRRYQARDAANSFLKN